MFRLLSRLTSPAQVSPPISPATLSNFFADKVTNLRASLPQPSVPAPAILPDFPPQPLIVFPAVTALELTALLSRSKKSGSPKDIFPPKLLCKILPAILPTLLHLFNTSLATGLVPSSFKRAHIRPILKKPQLNPTDPSNYRPISQLPFLSKVLERVVASRINSHMVACNIDETYQSGFKSGHSTETALLNVSDCLRRAADRGCASILVLLDLSSAFDTIDHTVLLDRLHSFLGISGTVLDWFRSYLSSRTQSVVIDDVSSDSTPIRFGVPQGSVLGPLLFRIYLLPLSSLLRNLGLSFHLYADDTQIFVSSSPASLPYSITDLLAAYSSISDWLSTNFLRLNHSKTEVLLVGTPALVKKSKSLFPSLTLGGNTIIFSDCVRNLGVVFDEHLSFKPHIRNVSKSSLCFLRNFSRIRSHFDRQSLETAVHAFITSRLDYCNSLLVNLPFSSLRPLQLVQNYAARLLLRRPRFSPSKPLLHELHWLPVRSRTHFKILLFTFKALNNKAPSYLSSALSPRHVPRALRSSHAPLLNIPRSSLCSMGDCSFSICAPKLWNALPAEIRSSPSLTTFKRLLKTHLFNIAFSPS